MELLPRDAQVTVVVPDLGVLPERIALLQKLKVASLLAQLQGFNGAAEGVDAVVGSLGIDLRSREAMKQAGLAPERGGAVVSFKDGRSYAVVGAGDEKRLLQSVATLAGNRLGATQRTSRAENGLTVVTFAKPGSATPELAFIMLGKYAFVASGAQVPLLRRAAELPRAQSLAEAADYQAALKRLPRERDLIVVGEGSEGTFARARGTAILRLEPALFRIAIDIPPLPSGMWPGWDKRPGPDLTGLLPADAFLLVRAQVDPLALEPVLDRLVPQRLLNVLSQAGVYVQNDLLGNLLPGSVAAISLAPNASLADGMPSFDVRRTNPLQYVQGVLVGPTKDGAKANRMLQKVADAGPRLGFRADRSQMGASLLWSSRYAAGEGASWTMTNDRILVAGPKARLEQTLQLLAQGQPRQLSPALKSALEAEALTAVLDVAQLTRSIRALPPEAWGVGGFAMRATALHWLEATDDVKALVFGASTKDGVLEVQLALQLGTH